jgi:hypothetical protein
MLIPLFFPHVLSSFAIIQSKGSLLPSDADPPFPLHKKTWGMYELHDVKAKRDIVNSMKA